MDFDLLVDGKHGPFSLGHIEPDVQPGHLMMPFDGEGEILAAACVH